MESSCEVRVDPGWAGSGTLTAERETLPSKYASLSELSDNR
jgi:hypothetical protein